MIFPNKVVSLEQSALSLTPVILELGPSPISVAQAYEEVGDEFESIDQFLLALDLLFAIGRIDVDMASGIISYAS